LNDPHNAADLSQDICKGSASFERRSNVQTWIYGIAHRKVIDQMRKQGRIDVNRTLPYETCAVVARG